MTEVITRGKTPWGVEKEGGGRGLDVSEKGKTSKEGRVRCEKKRKRKDLFQDPAKNRRSRIRWRLHQEKKGSEGFLALARSNTTTTGRKREIQAKEAKLTGVRESKNQKKGLHVVGGKMTGKGSICAGMGIQRTKKGVYSKGERQTPKEAWRKGERGGHLGING